VRTRYSASIWLSFACGELSAEMSRMALSWPRESKSGAAVQVSGMCVASK
jgi:hypothetical protein